MRQRLAFRRGMKNSMNNAEPLLGAMLESEPPLVSTGEAAAMVQDRFGLAVRAYRLTGERDLNFHLIAEDGRELLLKVTNPAEPRDVTDLQTQALLHIERENPTLPVPRVLRATDGAPQAIWKSANGQESVIRVLSFLRGEQLFRLQGSPTQRRRIGECLATLDIALSSFDHPAADHDLLWDIKHAPRLRSILSQTRETKIRELAERFLDIFETEVAPVLPTLRRQVIHNDFNLHNILVNPVDQDTITGVIDFGDIVRTPLVVDVAVAASYHISQNGHPLHKAAQIISGFHAVLPLTAAELDILYDLIAIRMVTTVAITNWRAARYPENSAYILRNNPPARTGLLCFAALSRRESRAYLARTCGLE